MKLHELADVLLKCENEEVRNVYHALYFAGVRLREIDAIVNPPYISTVKNNDVEKL